MANEERNAAIQKEHELPDLPEGATLKRYEYVMGRNDWYAETEDGIFYWLDPRGRTWKRCSYGPMR